jgi:hypothetical protein
MLPPIMYCQTGKNKERKETTELIDIQTCMRRKNIGE